MKLEKQCYKCAVKFRKDDKYLDMEVKQGSNSNKLKLFVCEKCSYEVFKVRIKKEVSEK